MSKEFIEKAYNASSIELAALQEKQLSYFIESELQPNNISDEYLKAWAERQFISNDYFLNYVKSVFKTENFLFFFKYLRKPLPSAKLVNNKIKPQLNRVFTSENSEFKYDIRGKEQSEVIKDLKIEQFEKELFYRLLFKHNSLVAVDADENEPYRYFIDIDSVLSIECDSDGISRIAYTGLFDNDGKEEKGIIYIDENVYSVYDKKHDLIKEVAHDIGHCPVNFINPNKYKNDPIIRESVFTFVREELEEYCFLKTLQKMTEPNGAIPVVTKLQSDSDSGNDIATNSGELSADVVMGSQRAEYYNQLNNKQTGELQAGTIHDVPPIMKNDGSFDMEAVKSYLNFFYIPIEALDYLKTRIVEIENSIISTVIGTIDTSNEESKNEMQIEKSIIVLENTLILLANSMNYGRGLSDYNMLALKYGKDLINEVFVFYGTDYFLESEKSLYEQFEKAPNTIERKNILVRLNQNRYKNNIDRQNRIKLLYDLLPFVSDKDFDAGKDKVDNTVLMYQIQFNYWITQFEARYGDIVVFYNTIEGDKSNKLNVINQLIIQIIKEYESNSSNDGTQQLT